MFPVFRRLIWIAVAAATTGVIAASAGQTPAPPNQLSRATGLVVGRVIDGATNAPLTGVIVMMTGGSPAVTPGGMRPTRVIVDPQGRFVFNELPAGSFNITATKAGYLNGVYGALRPDSAGRPLQLQDGERASDVVLRLWRFSTISGTVTDDAGDPVPYARVQALKRTIVAGRWKLVNSNIGADVDQRGVYRITGLLPGDYALVITSLTSSLPLSLLQVAEALKRLPPAESGLALRDLTTNGTAGYVNDLSQGFPIIRAGDLMIQSSGNAMVGPDGRSIETYPTVWFPAAATPAEASLVTVGPGEDRIGIDIRPTLTKALRVSGTVIGPDGPVAHLALRLVPARLDAASAEITSSLSLSLTTAMTSTDASGAFTFVAVPSGDFIVRALTSPRPPVETPPPGGSAPPAMVPTDPTLWAATPVSVADADVTGVNVSLRAGLRVTGRVEFVGATTNPTPAELRAIRVFMDPADGRTIARPTAYQAQIDSEGRFYTIGLMAGRYLLRVDGPPRGWTLKSAMLNGADICDVPLVLDANDLAGLVLTFTDRPSSVTGTVRNSGGQPDDDATVLMFPTDGRWTDLGSSPRRWRTMRASRSGAFSATGLPPGDYFVIAVSDAIIGNWQEPAFLQTLARSATRITLADGQALSLLLTTTGGIVR